jgi:hypothetical protein
MTPPPSFGSRSRLSSRALTPLACAFALAAATEARAQILAQAVPVETCLTVRPNQPAVAEVVIRNRGDLAVTVCMRLSDWRMNAAGELDLVPLGTTAATLDGHARFEPAELALAPGAAGTVRVTTILPDTGVATRHGMLLGEVRPASGAAGADGARLHVELGTSLFVSRVPPEAARVELTGMNVRPEADSTVRTSVRLWNGAQRHVDVSGEVVIADSAGVPVTRGWVPAGVVLPGATRQFTWVCDARLAPGRYSVTARFNSGAPDPVVGRTEFRFPMGRPMVVAPPIAAGR